MSSYDRVYKEHLDNLYRNGRRFKPYYKCRRCGVVFTYDKNFLTLSQNMSEVFMELASDLADNPYKTADVPHLCREDVIGMAEIIGWDEVR